MRYGIRGGLHSLIKSPRFDAWYGVIQSALNFQLRAARSDITPSNKSICNAIEGLTIALVESMALNAKAHVDDEFFMKKSFGGVYPLGKIPRD